MKRLFKKNKDEGVPDLTINRISKKADIVLNIWFAIWTLVCVLPLLLVVIVSFSSEQSIFENGYSFFPSEWSLAAYEFFFKLGDQLIRSYGITIFVTVVGTLFSLAISASFAYVLSRSDYAYNRLFTLLMLFTMLFNGGIVATYMVNTQLLGLGNSVWALIFPMSFNAFYIVVLRTFYKSIPVELIEAARVDGASTWRTFWKIIFPIMKPMHATVAVITALAVWNDVMTPLIIMSGKGQNTLPLAQLTFQTQFGTNYNLAFASYLLALIPIIIFYVICQKHIINGVVNGAVK